MMSSRQNGVELSGQVSSSGSSSANSTKDLISDRDNASLPDVHVTTESAGHFDMSYARRYITVAVLTLVNLLNYMDRSTIAGVLEDVQKYFDIEETLAGLTQIIFVVGFMFTAPVFGYMGDRYTRKWLMVGGIALWSAVTLAGSFVPRDMFGLFVGLRGVVGIGEASYVTIAPSLISDMFLKRQRSVMLMIFYFAIPVGSGLGYIVGSAVAEALGGWEWAFRVTPGIGILCVLLIIFVAKDPPRGMAENSVNTQSKSSVKEDMLALLKTKTYVLSTFGNAAVTFVSGALALYAPKFMFKAYRVSGDYDISFATVSLYTGIVTVAAGILGVGAGTTIAQLVKKRHANGDALVCAAGLIISTPFLFASMVVCQFNMPITWVAVLIGEILVFMNWSLCADMLLYTVAATRRSTAQAMQIFTSHALGDAASPLLIGVMADEIRAGKEDTYHVFKSLQYSLYVTLFVSLLGGGCFLMSSLFLVKDKKAADDVNRGISRSGLVHRRPAHCLPLDDMVPMLGAEDSDDDFILNDDDDPILPT